MEHRGQDIYESCTVSLNELFDKAPELAGALEGIRYGKNQFYLYRRKVEKTIDAGWIEAIEDTLISLDNVMRKPRNFIETKEELLPIELSRSITADSVKHLAQHTHLIHHVDEDGMIIPTKVMNYYKDESWDTYENRFINTLIDRLYGFVLKRCQKIYETAGEANIAELKFDSRFTRQAGEQIHLHLELESRGRADDREVREESGLMERLEHLRQMVMELKDSGFVKQMNGLYIKPPIMRTNAILKNTDYRQCLILWEFIESYDKAGFEMKISEETLKPEDSYIEEIYQMSALNYALFKQHLTGELEEELKLRTRKNKKRLTPRFIRNFVEEAVEAYDFNEVEFRKIVDTELTKRRKTRSEGEKKIQEAIKRALLLEHQKKLDAQATEEERERRRLLAEQRAEEKRLREQERLEKERQARVEALRQERIRRQEEMKRRQEEERLEMEKRRLESVRQAMEDRQRLWE